MSTSIQDELLELSNKLVTISYELQKNDFVGL